MNPQQWHFAPIDRKDPASTITAALAGYSNRFKAAPTAVYVHHSAIPLLAGAAVSVTVIASEAVKNPAALVFDLPTQEANQWTD